MIYGSVCSGIEAASVAWGPLGWSPAFFAEVDKFPSAVLAHHYGSNMPGENYDGINGVPNYGDMSKFEEWPDHAIDVFVGGTPCQDFSVAGRRAGVDGARGNLTFTYAEIARRYRPRWLVWENVPGVFSLNSGDDFGAVLACFAGYPDGSRFETPGGGWRNFGIVPGAGPDCYGLAWRVLDAQYVRVDGFAYAVPQRRRRVFIVGYLGDWRRAASVLFEPESMRGDIPPRREAGKGIAAGFEIGPCGGCETDVSPTIDTRAKDGPIRNQLAPCVMVPAVARSPNAHGVRIDAESETLIAETANTLLAKGNDSHDATLDTYIAFPAELSGTQHASSENLSPALSVSHSMAVAFHENQRGEVSLSQTASVLGVGGGKPGQGYPAVAIQERAVSENIKAGPMGKGFQEDVDYTLEARTSAQSVSYDLISVRRLMPIEYARLQGFPDNHARVPYRGKPASECPDGPQYKSYGNSMPVNVMRWIGRRIDLVESLTK